MIKTSLYRPDTETGAIFSPCEKYRYILWRTWDYWLPKAVFIGLNPSTADAYKDDPTVAKCQRYARSWGGYGGIVMLNIFAFRATDPGVMKKCPEPVGQDNDEWIKFITKDAPLVVAKWGNHGQHLGRSAVVCSYLKSLKCLDTSKTGEPKHVLYLRGDLMYQNYSRPQNVR